LNPKFDPPTTAPILYEIKDQIMKKEKPTAAQCAEYI